MPEGNFIAILEALSASEIEFILVGGLAAVLDGAPVTTYDTDIVHSRNEANVKRPLVALDQLDAVFRIQPDRRLKPSATHLAGLGHMNLITRHGPLDLWSAGSAWNHRQGSGLPGSASALHRNGHR